MSATSNNSHPGLLKQSVRLEHAYTASKQMSWQSSVTSRVAPPPASNGFLVLVSVFGPATYSMNHGTTFSRRANKDMNNSHKRLVTEKSDVLYLLPRVWFTLASHHCCLPRLGAHWLIRWTGSRAPLMSLLVICCMGFGWTGFH